MLKLSAPLWAVALAASSFPTAAQNLTVERTTIEVPAGHRIAYSPRNGGLLTRGGVATLGRIDTRILDRATWLWSDANPAQEPPAIWQFAMATDTARQRVVMFGGSPVTTGATALDETWEWDGIDWQRIATTNAPTPRRIEAMAFDQARRVMVLYGGFGTGGVQNPLGDTWEYDGAGWTQRQPLHQPPIGPGKLAWDPLRQVCVLLGVGSTWEWDGNDWSGPLAAESVILDDVLVSDDSGGRVLRISESGIVRSWDGARWTQISTRAAPRAPVRFGYDPNPGGGVLLVDEAAEMLRFSGSTWQRVGPFLRPLPGDSALAWDADSTRLLSAQLDGAVTARDSMTGTWGTVHPGDPWSPLLRYASWALDTARQQVVMHGVTQNGAAGRTLLFDMETNRWTEASPVTPGPAASRTAAAYDEARQRVVLWGGYYGAGAPSPVWEWDGHDWERIDTSHAPEYRLAFHRMVYDPDREVVVMFGGRNDTVRSFSDTWEWDGQQWTLREAHHPLFTDRYITGATYDIARRRILLLLEATGVIGEEAYEWDGDAGTWLHAPGVGAALGGASGAVLGYDRANLEVVVARADPAMSWTVRSADPATSEQFGQGCPGAHGDTPRLSSRRTRLPWLADRTVLEVERLATGVGTVALLLGTSDRSWNGNSLPADLSPIGLPGCSLFISIEEAELLTATNGRVSWNLNIPDDSRLLGRVLFAQAGAFDPSANPGGLALSNAVRLQTGQR